ncbi:Reverse transcriptase zinc-binding domain [Sesbania bispinosa]|nr:Reverse transcriptase zinc-binding domain [Sesbania bispinosa]
MEVAYGFTVSRIWKLEGPQQLRCFLWTVARGGLKTNSRRFQCRISSDDKCPLCNSQAETEEHILRDCTMVQGIWNSISHVHKIGGWLALDKDVRSWVHEIRESFRASPHMAHNYGIKNVGWTHPVDGWINAMWMAPLEVGVL